MYIELTVAGTATDLHRIPFYSFCSKQKLSPKNLGKDSRNNYNIVK